MRPAQVACGSPTVEPLERKFLRALAEHGALPVDLAALLLRCPQAKILRLIEEGARLGSIRTAKYAGEPHIWAVPREAGLKRSATKFGRRSRPKAVSLDHRREVLGALLLLREEKPGWRWICEAVFRQANLEGIKVPDGGLKRGDKRWAIEVQRSSRRIEELREKLRRLCADFDQVVYFCRGTSRTSLEALKASGEFPNLQVRPLPSEMSDQLEWPTSREEYTPSPRARRVLRVVHEEGLVFVAHLHRVLGWKTSEVTRILGELEENRCIRRGLEAGGDGGWVWCNPRGVARSGTGLAVAKPAGRGALSKRFVLMEVRLDAFARWPESTWVTRRMLLHGLPAKSTGIPTAVVVRGGLRYAVMVLESCPWSKKATAALLKRWEKEYTGVLCYRTAKLARWTDRLIEDHGLEGVEVRDIPKPPESSPYRTLEDEWRTGKEPYEPTEDQSRLLWLVSTEGIVWMSQLHRLLGCSPEEAERQVEALEEHNCVTRKGDLLRCNARGSRLSRTGLSRPTIPGDVALTRHREAMEIRLDLMKRFPSLGWKTRREISKGRRGSTGHPMAIATIAGKRYAIGIPGPKNRTLDTVAQFSRWSNANHGVKCYCEPKDVAYFERMCKTHGLDAVEVVEHPEATLERRRALAAAPKSAEQKRREKYEAKKARARHAVSKAVRSGRLIKPSKCQHGHAVESPADLHAHHEDYSKPLEVEWLCRKCHGKKHRRRAARKRR